GDATSEYALTSSASQKRSRGVSVKRPSRSSAAANATEWTSRSSCPPKTSPTSPKTRATSPSERTSHSVTWELETDSASSRTPFSMRSPWYVNASCAPPSASRFAIAHAIERRLATPRTSPPFPPYPDIVGEHKLSLLRRSVALLALAAALLSATPAHASLVPVPHPRPRVPARRAYGPPH